MKNIFLIMLILNTAAAQAQIAVGTGGMTIKAGTTVFMDSLTLVPANDLTIASNQLQKFYTPVPAQSGPTGSVARRYQFSTPVVYSGVAGFYYANGELAGNVETNLQMAYASVNTNPTWFTTTGSTVDAANNRVYNTFTNTTLAKLTATSSGVTLPLLINALQADRYKDQVLLKWNVSNNELYDAFTPQVSRNATEWTMLTTVTADNSSREANYTYPDRDMDFQVKYYRVLLHQKNGEKKYTNTVAVKNSDDASLQVSTTGAGAVFTFSNATAKRVAVYDMSGRMVYESNTARQQYDLTGIAAGTYIVSYALTTGITGNRKFVIN